MTISVVTQVDCIHASVPNIPTSTPAVAGYDSGSPEIMWTAGDYARFPKAGHLHINQGFNVGPLVGDILDVETGAWTITSAVAALGARLAAKKELAVYVDVSNLTALANAITAEKLAPVNLWLANWNLSESEAATLVTHQFGPLPIKAVQWASPSSNPNTLLPGSKLTLSRANADLSVKDASWHPAPPGTPPPPPPKTLSALLVRGLLAKIVHSTDGIHWS